MIKKLITRIDLEPLDGLMLIAGLLGGLGGAFLAVNAAEHRNAQPTVSASEVPPAPASADAQREEHHPAEK
jgi:hypothetical protein